MANIQQFPSYSGPENLVTNNTLLLLSRLYQIDRNLFQMAIGKALDGTTIPIGPAFTQQTGAGGAGIPDAIIAQDSFKIVVETKLDDQMFWGKEEYASHFNKESVRILLTLSKSEIAIARAQAFREALVRYDSEEKAPGNTTHQHLTFAGLIKQFRAATEETRSRFKFEVEQLLEGYEEFIYSIGLVDDEYNRMHVFAINDSEEDNVEYSLYYNQAHRNERPHKFVGLYRNKEVKYIAETKCIVLPRQKAHGTYDYNVLKGAEHWNPAMQARLEDFFEAEGWGYDGATKFHLFDKLVPTSFKKTSPYGIMGPRHFLLSEYIGANAKENLSAEELAGFLKKVEWE